MKCPECGYTIADGAHKCIRCGYSIKSLRPLDKEEIHDENDEPGYKEINPEDMIFGRGRRGGIFEDLLEGFSIGGFGGSVFQSFGNVLEDLMGGIFGFDSLGMGDDDEESEEEEENYTYDALGYRVLKKKPETIIVREIECYDENGEPADAKTQKKKEKQDRKRERDKNKK